MASVDQGNLQNITESGNCSSSDEVGALLLNRYRVEKQLGEGSYGKVKLATDTKTGDKVAMKIIHKSCIKKPVHITRLKREIRIMKLLHHPHIVRLYEVAETEKEIILVMEYMEGGELFDYIVTQKRLKEKMARKFFRQILSAMKFCHASFVIHRDLKPENLLLDTELNIKIIDFGFVNLFDPADYLNTFCGSPFYASPEMILGKQYIGPEVDIWSLGVILFALLSGHLPFRDNVSSELYRKIANALYTMPEYIPPLAQDLIRKMLTVDPAKRITLDEILNHPWVSENCDGAPNVFLPPRPSIAAIDDYILHKMVSYGFEKEQVSQQILENSQCPAFAVYYLIKEQVEREKEKATKKQLLLFQQRTEHTASPSSSNGSERSVPNQQAELTVASPAATKEEQSLSPQSAPPALPPLPSFAASNALNTSANANEVDTTTKVYLEQAKEQIESQTAAIIISEPPSQESSTPENTNAESTAGEQVSESEEESTDHLHIKKAQQITVYKTQQLPHSMQSLSSAAGSSNAVSASGSPEPTFSTSQQNLTVHASAGNISGSSATGENYRMRKNSLRNTYKTSTGSAGGPPTSISSNALDQLGNSRNSGRRLTIQTPIEVQSLRVHNNAATTSAKVTVSNAAISRRRDRPISSSPIASSTPQINMMQEYAIPEDGEPNFKSDFNMHPGDSSARLAGAVFVSGASNFVSETAVDQSLESDDKLGASPLTGSINQIADPNSQKPHSRRKTLNDAVVKAFLSVSNSVNKLRKASNEDDSSAADISPASHRHGATLGGSLNSAASPRGSSAKASTSLPSSANKDIASRFGRRASNEPRSIKVMYGVDTTSTKPVEEIIIEVQRVLTLNNVTFSRKNFKFACSQNGVELEIEICKIHKTNMHGLVFKRIKGTIWNYQNFCQNIILQWRM